METLKRATLVLLVFGLALSAPAQSLPSTRPGRAGLSAERLARATQAIEADVQAGRVAGAVALIVRRGRVAYIEALGMADREENRPMREDTIFRIYSMSKPITSVGLMMLYEEGRFRLSDPISKYIPELGGLDVLVEDLTRDDFGFDGLGNLLAGRSKPGPVHAEFKTVRSKRDMTVQDLLRHTSGLTYGFFPSPQVDRMYVQKAMIAPNQTLTDMVGKLSRTPLKHQPGSTWEYSVSVDVQGRLIEVLSGRPFDEYLAERIFEPLGMVDTGFWVPEEKVDRFAQLYAPAPKGDLQPADPAVSLAYYSRPSFLSGGGGLVSTAADYARFCQMMLNGGELEGVRLLSRKTVELMTTDHLGDVPYGTGTNGYGFGLGFAVATDHTRSGLAGSLGEYYWGGAAGTRFWIDPAEEMIGIYMVQILPHTGLDYGGDFKHFAYQAIAD